MSMASKRQHTVPKFYLNYFVTDRMERTPRFWVYDKAGGSARVQTPVNTAVEGHLYSFEMASGANDDTLDRLLSRIEADAKPILDRWQLPGVMATQDEKQQIAEFLALMHTRSPRAMGAITEASEAIGFAVTRFLADRPDEVRKFLESERSKGRRDVPSVEQMVEMLRSAEERFVIKVNREDSVMAVE